MLGERKMEDWQYVVDPYWRVNYTPPKEIMALLGGDSATLTMCKVCEIIESYVGELLEDSTIYRIKQDLLRFVGDRDLRVSKEIIDNSMRLVVMFNDDDEVRRILRL